MSGFAVARVIAPRQSIAAPASGRRVLPARIRILGETGADDAIEGRRAQRLARRDRRRLGVHDRPIKLAWLLP